MARHWHTSPHVNNSGLPQQVFAHAARDFTVTNPRRASLRGMKTDVFHPLARPLEYTNRLKSELNKYAGSNALEKRANTHVVVLHVVIHWATSWRHQGCDRLTNARTSAPKNPSVAPRMGTFWACFRGDSQGGSFPKCQLPATKPRGRRTPRRESTWRWPPVLRRLDGTVPPDLIGCPTYIYAIPPSKGTVASIWAVGSLPCSTAIHCRIEDS